MKLYKLTDENCETKNNTQWGAGVTHKVPPTDNPELRTDKVIHAYKNINLGLLLNPIHSYIDNPKCFEAEGNIAVEDYGKVGCFELTTIKEIKLPVWYKSPTDVQIRFAILCAESVIKYFDGPEALAAINAAKEYLTTKTAAYASRAADSSIDFGKLADMAVSGEEL